MHRFILIWGFSSLPRQLCTKGAATRKATLTLQTPRQAAPEPSLFPIFPESPRSRGGGTSGFTYTPDPPALIPPAATQPARPPCRGDAPPRAPPAPLRPTFSSPLVTKEEILLLVRA